MSAELQALAAKLGLSVSTGWDGTPEKYAAYARDHGSRMMKADENDIQIASRVRGLMRNDLDHEAVVCCARDRICALTVEKAALLEALTTMRDTLRSLQPAMNVMAREVMDDIIKDQIEPAIALATGASA